MSAASPPLRLAAWIGVVCAMTSGLVPRAQDKRLGFSFTNMARQAGLDAVTVFGGQATNTYLLETTGSGAAAIDYDVTDGSTSSTTTRRRRPRQQREGQAGPVPPGSIG